MGSLTDIVAALGRGGKRGTQIKALTHPHTAAKLQTPERQAAYRRRKWLAKPLNGWIRSVLGFRRFRLRGLHRLQAEFKPVCLTLNPRRMGTMTAA